MNKYELLGVVGEGAYGIVLKCRQKETGELVAIKKFKETGEEDDEAARKTTTREVRILRMLKHPNIVCLREAFRRKGKLYLVFEFVSKNLLEVLEKEQRGVGAEATARYMLQLSFAIECCQAQAIIHRDIKPENLLVNAPKRILKLCDFGFSRTAAAGDDLSDYVATRWYRSPELLLGSTRYDRSVDVFAMGCIMGELSDGQPLFPGDSEIDQLYVIQKVLGPLTRPQHDLFLKNPRFAGLKFPDMSRPETLRRKMLGKLPSTAALDFMQTLVHMDPTQRPSAARCVDHVYFDELRSSSDYEEQFDLHSSLKENNTTTTPRRPTLAPAPAATTKAASPVVTMNKLALANHNAQRTPPSTSLKNNNEAQIIPTIRSSRQQRSQDTTKGNNDKNHRRTRSNEDRRSETSSTRASDDPPTPGLLPPDRLGQRKQNRSLPAEPKSDKDDDAYAQDMSARGVAEGKATSSSNPKWEARRPQKNSQKRRDKGTRAGSVDRQHDKAQRITEAKTNRQQRQARDAAEADAKTKPNQRGADNKKENNNNRGRTQTKPTSSERRQQRRYPTRMSTGNGDDDDDDDYAEDPHHLAEAKEAKPSQAPPPMDLDPMDYKPTPTFSHRHQNDDSHPKSGGPPLHSQAVGKRSKKVRRLDHDLGETKDDLKDIQQRVDRDIQRELEQRRENEIRELRSTNFPQAKRPPNKLQGDPVADLHSRRPARLASPTPLLRLSSAHEREQLAEGARNDRLLLEKKKMHLENNSSNPPDFPSFRAQQPH